MWVRPEYARAGLRYASRKYGTEPRRGGCRGLGAALSRAGARNQRHSVGTKPAPAGATARPCCLLRYAAASHEKANPGAGFSKTVRC